MPIKTAVIVAFFFIEAILLFDSGNCSAAIKKVGEYSCSDLTDIIYGEKSLQYRKDDFGKYDVDKQYAIFICGNQYVHPPMMYLAELFAKEGAKVVGFLKTKLLSADDDLTVRDLIFVFTEMSRLKTYNVATDDELMHLISERLEGMKDPEWKRTTEQMVAEMKQ
jgi:hypothetical protein